MIYNYSNIYSIYGLYLIWPVYTSCALRILQCEDFCDKLEFYKLQHIYKKKIMMSYVLLLMLILFTINSEKLCKYEQNLKHKRSHLWLMRAVMVVSLQKTIHRPPKWVIIFFIFLQLRIFSLYFLIKPIVIYSAILTRLTIQF